MRLLYLDLGSSGRASAELLMRYDMVCVESYFEAMQRILTDYFDAFVISDDTRDSTLPSFTAVVHQEAPELPTFVVSAWGRDLISVLESVGPFAELFRWPTESTMIH